MLKSIHYLRGIAALLVVLYHNRNFINIGWIQFDGGYFGVDLFFMISGFVIVYATQKDISPISFLLKRFFRIYPVFLLLMLIVLFYGGGMIDRQFLKNLLFINNDFNQSAPFFAYATIFTAWTLMYEVLFYALFFISILINHKYRSIIAIGLVLIPFTLLNYLYSGTIHFNGYSSIDIVAKNSFMGLLKVFSCPMMLEFIVGIILAEFYLKLSSFKTSIDISNKLKSISTFLFFVALGYAIFCYFSGYRGGHGLSRSGMYALLLFSSALFYEYYHPIKSNTTLLFLGNISYSLYLLQAVSPTICSKYLNPFMATQGAGQTLFSIIFMLIMSYILYIFVEKPSIKFSRYLIKYLKPQSN